MEIYKTLETIGLTNNEIKILLYLLHNGVKTGNDIFTSIGIEKSSSYKAIKTLENKGFILSSDSERNRYYKAANIDYIKNAFDEKQKLISSAKQNFTKLLANFTTYSSNNYFNENVTIFSDENAYKDYHKELLKHPIKIIYTFASSITQYQHAGSKTQYQNMNKWFIPERVSKGIVVRVLYDQEGHIDASNLTNMRLLKECRQFQGELNMGCVFSIFGDRVGFTTTKEDRFWALVINDKMISSTLESVYNVIWEQSKLK